jgi:Type II intron maturase
LQQEYLARVDAVIKKSLSFEIEKKRSTIVDKYYQNKSLESFSSDIPFVCVDSIKEFLASSASEFFIRKVSINAPIKDIYVNLRLMGYIHPMKNKSVGNSALNFYADSVIVVYINSLIFSILSWYSGVDNFSKVKSLVQLLRKSCILTLANKHKKSVSWVYTAYGRDVGVLRGKEKIYLKSRASILSHRNKLDLKADFFLLDQCNVGPEISFFTKHHFEIAFVESCFVVHCLKIKNSRAYSICRVYDSVNSIKLMSIFNSKEIKIAGFTSVVIHLNRKRFSLCSKHYMEFKLGMFSSLNYVKLNKVC